MSFHFTARYVIREIINSFIIEPVFSVLMVTCILCSSIFASFYFGYVHHAEQKKADSKFGEKCFYVYFYDPSWPLDKKKQLVMSNIVKKGDLLEWLLNLDTKILNDLEVTLECKLNDDVVEDVAIDNSSLSLATEFIIKDGLILPPRIEETLRSKNFLVEGRYFTDDDYLNRNAVCLPPAVYSGNFTGEYEYLRERYTAKADGSYIIDGVKYIPVGVLESFSAIPDVPVTTIRDDVFIKNITFDFDHPVTRYEYETISNDLKQQYGELAMLSPLEIKTYDSKSFDLMIIMMFITASVVTSIIISILYDYMITRRTECFRAFRLCGMTRQQISAILVSKAVILLSVVFITGELLYHYVLLPVLEKEFEYLRNSSVISVYIFIYALFMTVSYIFIKTAVLRRCD